MRNSMIGALIGLGLSSSLQAIETRTAPPQVWFPASYSPKSPKKANTVSQAKKRKYKRQGRA